MALAFFAFGAPDLLARGEGGDEGAASAAEPLATSLGTMPAAEEVSGAAAAAANCGWAP